LPSASFHLPSDAARTGTHPLPHTAHPLGRPAQPLRPSVQPPTQHAQPPTKNTHPFHTNAHLPTQNADTSKKTSNKFINNALSGIKSTFFGTTLEQII
jgi:hypothetical protein